MLTQVLHYAVIVREVTVVNKCLVHANERVGTGRMPDTAFGGIALVGNPYLRLKIFQAVIMHHVLSIAHHFEYHQVTRMRKHESPFFAQRRVVSMV